MEESQTLTIEVDAQAAEILRAAKRRAQARGETLGSYLHQVLPAEEVESPARIIDRQHKAWNAFVEGMVKLTAHLPSGYVVDDSRDSIYD